MNCDWLHSLFKYFILHQEESFLDKSYFKSNQLKVLASPLLPIAWLLLTLLSLSYDPWLHRSPASSSCWERLLDAECSSHLQIPHFQKPTLATYSLLVLKDRCRSMNPEGYPLSVKQMAEQIISEKLFSFMLEFHCIQVSAKYYKYSSAPR